MHPKEDDMNIRNLLIILFAASLIAGPAYAKNKKAQAKGKELPSGLHKKAEKGAQFKVWASGPHAETFAILQTPEALKIGQERGGDK